jgi:hypothetical protein
LSPPWVDVPDAPSFDRTPSPGVMRNSGSNATIAMPPRNGNGNGRETSSATNVAMPPLLTMESPLAFHPSAEARPEARPEARAEPRPAPRTPTPAASAAPQLAEPLAESPFTNSFARLVADTPASPSAVEYDASTHTHHLEEPRTEISLDWPLEPRRPWLKIVAAVVVLVLIAGGGWYVLSRYDSSKTSPPNAAAAVEPTKASLVAAKTDTLLVKHESPPAGPPASVVKPGVVSQIVPSTKSPAPATSSATGSSKDEGPPADARHAAHVDGATSAPQSDPDLLAAPKMPSVKVDAITKMIDDSARRRADSVGNLIQQKPPTFKPKAYKPPA